MKKKLFSLLLICTFAIGLIALHPNQTFAQGAQFFDGLSDTAETSGFDTNQVSVPAMVGNIIGAVLGFIGTLFFVLMLYGGFTWMTAQGNDEQVGKAKKIITQAAIGILIVVIAYGLSDFILEAIIRSQASPGAPVAPTP